LTTGGILGNLGDRIFRGYVVDFVEWHIRDSFYWPNFNIADAAISTGIVLLIIDVIKNPEK
jgi:signal peptidase II